MTFTTEEISKLYEPFQPDEHEVRKGYSNKEKTLQYWFVYVSRTAIQKRFDMLFPGEWSSEIIGSPQRYDDGTVTVTVCITIRDISRCYNGSDKAEGKNFENTEKAAFTDAFKRAASMWGVGLYLQDAPQIKTQFDGYQDQAALKLAEQWVRNGFKHDVLTGEIEPPPVQRSQKQPAQGKKQHDKIVDWATADNLNTLVERFQEASQQDAMFLRDFAALAGIENPEDFATWNNTFPTGKEAYEQAWKTMQIRKSQNGNGKQPEQAESPKG